MRGTWRAEAATPSMVSIVSRDGTEIAALAEWLWATARPGAWRNH